MAGEGIKEVERLTGAGFSQQEVASYQREQTTKLQNAGFSQGEIDGYWGTNAKPAALGAVAANVNEHWTPDQAQVADSPIEMLAAGWDMSVAGLMQHAPKTVAPEKAGLLGTILSGVGQMAGDLVPAIVGGVAGASAGGAAGSVVPVVGTAGGALVGGGAGSAALPEAMRQVLMDKYRNGDLFTADDFLARSTEIAFNTGKAALIGGVSAPIGGVAGSKVLRATGSVGAAGVANVTSMAVSATGVASALEGKVPNAEDFVAGAAIALGFHAAGATAAAGKYALNARGKRVQANMQDIYARTGIPPWEQANRAKTDPSLRQEIFAEDVNGNRVDPQFRASKPAEPKPYKSKAPSTPEAAAKTLALPNPVAHPELASLIVGTENSAGYAKQHGIKESDVVSSAGAVGKYQIMPDTARQYMGDAFDVRTLKDPVVNEKVGQKIIADLQNRYRLPDGKVDVEAVLIAYNAGPGRANSFIRNGRNYKSLPLETQRYLERADRLGTPKDMVPAEGGGDGGGQPPKPPGGRAGPEEPGSELALAREAKAKTDEELTASLLGLVAEDNVPSMMERMKGLSEANYDRYVSELGPAKRLDKQLGLDGEVGTVTVEDMFRSTYASGERAGHFIKYGALDPITFERVGNPNDSYMGAYRLARKAGGNEREFTAFRLASRALDLEARGVKSGYSAEQLADASALVQKAGKRYAEAIGMVTRLQNHVLDYYTKSGMMSQESNAKVKKANPNYIPYKRASETETFRVGGRARGFQSRQTIKKMEGSDKSILEPLYADLENIHGMTRMADRNNAIAFLVDPQRRVGSIETIHVQEEIIRHLGMDPAARGTPQFQRQYEKALGEVLGIRPALEAPPETLKTWDHDADFIDQTAAREGFARGGKDTKNSFTYFRDGVPERWVADDPAVAAMIRGGNPTDIGTLQGVGRWFATLQRTGITAMPDYMIKAVARDQFTTSILYRRGGLPFENLLVGMPEVFKGTELFKEFVRTGGMGSALADMDLKYLQRDVDGIFAKTGILEGAVNVVKDPVEAARFVMERMDAMSRVGYYKRQQDQGVGSFKAAMDARKGYLDFAERGTSQMLNAWSGVTPFLRPAILGLDQLRSRFVTDPVGVTIRAAAIVTIPSVTLWALNWMADQELPDGQKYADIPRWQRDMFWITPPIAGVRFRIPKPRELGLAFGSFYERMLDSTIGNDPDAFKDFGQTFFTTFLPPAVPTVAVPVLENLTDHSFFTGRPLIPASLEDASNYMQYTAGTSETAVALARALGPAEANLVDVSPIVLQNYVRQWTGSVGSTVLSILDATMEPPGRPKQLADNPFVKSFVLRHNDMGAAPIESFYDGLENLRAKHRDLALAIDRQDPAEIDFTSKDAQAFLSLQQMSDAMRKHNTAIKAVTDAEDMSVDEKRQQIDDLYSSMIQISKGGNEVMRAVK